MGAVIGVLSAVDFGGPLNKTVYAFVLTLQAEGVKEPLTALQLVNTATPVGFDWPILSRNYSKISILKRKSKH